MCNWNDVEATIIRELGWLKNNIYPYSPNINPLEMSDDIFYRQIAVLIVSGKIKALE